METINIGYGHMALGFLLLIIPTYFLYRYRTGLVKDTLIAALRMTVQLFLIGFYLEYLFLWDKLWINLLWILLMIIIASSTALKRTHLPVRTLFMAVSVAFLVSLLVIDFYFLGLVVRPEKIFTARYFIPISGMILGNMLSANVIALNSFYGSLNRERQLYLYLLVNRQTPATPDTHYTGTNGVSVYYDSSVWSVCRMTEDATLGTVLELATADTADSEDYQAVLLQRGTADSYDNFIEDSEADLKQAYGVIKPRKVNLTVEGATVEAVRCDIRTYYAVLATITYDNGDVVYVSALTKLASISDVVNLVESVSLS